MRRAVPSGIFGFIWGDARRVVYPRSPVVSHTSFPTSSNNFDCFHPTSDLCKVHDRASEPDLDIISALWTIDGQPLLLLLHRRHPQQNPEPSPTSISQLLDSGKQSDGSFSRTRKAGGEPYQTICVPSKVSISLLSILFFSLLDRSFQHTCLALRHTRGDAQVRKCARRCSASLSPSPSVPAGSQMQTR